MTIIDIFRILREFPEPKSLRIFLEQKGLLNNKLHLVLSSLFLKRYSFRYNKWNSTNAQGLCIVYCGRVPAANAPGCTAAEGFLYKPWSSVVPTCTARCLHQRP